MARSRNSFQLFPDTVNYGYYDQPAYYRVNPHTSNVEYVPGYRVPRQRWIQKHDGSWLDLIPQTPDQSIFYHQSVSSEGGTNWISTVTISLWACSPKNLQCSAFAVACQQPRTTACQQRRVASCTVLFLSSDRLTADHRLSASCETDLHVPTRRKFVPVCDLFLFYVSTQCFHAC